MMPQSNIFVAAPVKMGCEGELKSLLASMNMAPGRVNSHNALVPFGEFDGLLKENEERAKAAAPVMARV